MHTDPIMSLFSPTKSWHLFLCMHAVLNSSLLQNANLRLWDWRKTHTFTITVTSRHSGMSVPTWCTRTGQTCTARTCRFHSEIVASQDFKQIKLPLWGKRANNLNIVAHPFFSAIVQKEMVKLIKLCHNSVHWFVLNC